MRKIIVILGITKKLMKFTSVLFFIPDFNLSNCKSGNFTLKCSIQSFYTDIILK